MSTIQRSYPTCISQRCSRRFLLWWREVLGDESLVRSKRRSTHLRTVTSPQGCCMAEWINIIDVMDVIWCMAVCDIQLHHITSIYQLFFVFHPGYQGSWWLHKSVERMHPCTAGRSRTTSAKTCKHTNKLNQLKELFYMWVDVSLHIQLALTCTTCIWKWLRPAARLHTRPLQFLLNCQPGCRWWPM